MYIVRFAHNSGVSFGVLDCDDQLYISENISDISEIEGHVREIADHPFGEVTFTGKQWNISEVRFLAPILATKIISVTKIKNGVPQFVIKPSTTLVGNKSIIRRPEDAQELYAGATIAVTISRPGNRFSPEQAQSAILGYSLACDITALDIAAIDGDFSRAKAFDGFCPIGPWINTQCESEGIKVTELVDGVLSQEVHPFALDFTVEEIISELSHTMTLLPGDTILLPTKYAGNPLRHDSQVLLKGYGLGCLSVFFHAETA